LQNILFSRQVSVTPLLRTSADYPGEAGWLPAESYREKVKRNKEIVLQMSPDTAVADEHLRLITGKILASKFLNATDLALGELPMRAINIKHNLFRIWWKNEE
jgi:hypothetical protein